MLKSIEEISGSLKRLESAYINFQKNENYRNNSDIVINELSFSNFIADVSFLIQQFRYLIKSHNVFMAISTYNERNNIRGQLDSLSYCLDNRDYYNAYEYISSLKKNVREYWNFLWHKKDQISDFEEELVKLKKEYSDIQLYLQNLKQMIQDKKDAINDIENLEETYNDLGEKLADAEEKNDKISDLLNQSKSNEWIITTFAKTIENRQEDLVKLQNKMEQYEKHIHDYGEEHEILKNNAHILIEDAKKALRLKTAEWISSAIQIKHDEEDRKWNRLWLVWSAFFLFLTIILGAFIAFPEYMIAILWKVFGQFQNVEKLMDFLGKHSLNNDWKLIVWRIAMLPLTWAATWFCSSQYLKQKNLIQDYAYKLVLAQSLVGFSEEFLKYKDNESEAYKAYIEKVLAELLQDPLRSRESNTSYKKSKEALEDIADIIAKFKLK